MSKALLFLLATIFVVFLPTNTQNSNGGFYLVLKKKTGINWNDQQIQLLGNLSAKVYEEFRNVIVKSNNKKDYIHTIKHFADLTNSNENSPNDQNLLNLINTTIKNLNSTNNDIKIKSKKIAENLLSKMSEIASGAKYQKLNNDIRNVFVFKKNETGEYIKYNDEINRLANALGKQGEKLFPKEGESKELRKYVLDFLENKFLNVVLEFIEKCPIQIEYSAETESYSEIKSLNTRYPDAVKNCVNKYFKELYEYFKIITQPDASKGKKFYQFKNAYKKMSEIIQE